MKKVRLFILSLLGIGAISFSVGVNCYASNLQPKHEIVYAEGEETPSDSEPTEPSETSEEETLDPINVDEETSNLSQVAKDTIAVIKEFLSQPLVIGGVSTTLGAIVLWVVAKLFGHYLHKRDTKYDKKIEELLGKIGISDELIETLRKEYDNLYKVVKEIIDNTKNVKVKKHLEDLIGETKSELESTKVEITESVESAKTEIIETTKTESTELENEISSILEG